MAVSISPDSDALKKKYIDFIKNHISLSKRGNISLKELPKKLKINMPKEMKPFYKTDEENVNDFIFENSDTFYVDCQENVWNADIFSLNSENGQFPKSLVERTGKIVKLLPTYGIIKIKTPVPASVYFGLSQFEDGKVTSFKNLCHGDKLYFNAVYFRTKPSQSEYRAELAWRSTNEKYFGLTAEKKKRKMSASDSLEVTEVDERPEEQEIIRLKKSKKSGLHKNKKMSKFASQNSETADLPTEDEKISVEESKNESSEKIESQEVKKDWAQIVDESESFEGKGRVVSIDCEGETANFIPFYETGEGLEEILFHKSCIKNQECWNLNDFIKPDDFINFHLVLIDGREWIVMEVTLNPDLQVKEGKIEKISQRHGFIKPDYGSELIHFQKSVILEPEKHNLIKKDLDVVLKVGDRVSYKVIPTPNENAIAKWEAETVTILEIVKQSDITVKKCTKSENVKMPRKLSRESGRIFPKSARVGIIKFGKGETLVASVLCNVLYFNQKHVKNMMFEIKAGQKVEFDAILISSKGNVQWKVICAWIGIKPGEFVESQTFVPSVKSASPYPDHASSLAPSVDKKGVSENIKPNYNLPSFNKPKKSFSK